MSEAVDAGGSAEADMTATLPSPGPMTPAFLLQLVKLLRRKETLLNKVTRHAPALGRENYGSPARKCAKRIRRKF
jgi:hypothetical protein